MNGRRRLGIGLLVVGLAMTWLVLRQDPPPPLAAGNAEPSPAAAVPTQAGIAAAPAAGEREPALTDLPAAEANQFVVRVRGLHPDVPWTTPIRIHLDTLDGPWIHSPRPRMLASDSVESSLAADGLATISLPWAGAWRIGSIRAEDPNYTSFVQRFHGPDPIRVVVDVRPLATLRGRFVDSRGKAVRDAHVTAFPIVGERVQSSALARPELGWVDRTGSWQLRIPADTEALVVAVPWDIQRRVLESVTINHPTLLPTSKRVRAEVGGTVDVGDLVLGAATLVHGDVRWTNDEPAPALVRLDHPSATRLTLPSTDATLLAWPNGQVLPSSLIETGPDGSFRLPATLEHASALVVELVSSSAPLAGNSPGHPLQADGRVTITLPTPVTLRAIRRGDEVVGARIEIEGRPETCCPGPIVPNTPFRVRAVDGPSHSAWVRLGPGDAGRTVDLELASKQ